MIYHVVYQRMMEHNYGYHPIRTLTKFRYYKKILEFTLYYDIVNQINKN